MCQGLPCIGAPIRLTRDFVYEGKLIPKGSTGVVRKENIKTREVYVYFKKYDITVWLSEETDFENMWLESEK